jgi:hypothetical protein
MTTYTFDIPHTPITDVDERTCYQQGVFTSDDIAGLPGADDDARARAYVESLDDGTWDLPREIHIWRQHLEPWSLVETVPPDLTWTYTGGAP